MKTPLRGRWAWAAITWGGRVCFTTPDSRYQAWDTLCNMFGMFNSPIALAQLQGFRVRRKLMRSSGSIRLTASNAAQKTEEQRVEDKNRSLEALGAAFADIAEGTVKIPQRNCKDVQRFLERLERASAATRKHNIHFG